MRSWFLIIGLVLFLSVQGQDSTSYHSLRTDTAGIHKGRLIGVLSVQGALYLGSLGGLYFLWYKDYPQSGFHFFNDDNEWLQMDKCGHATTSYYISMIGYWSYRWAGLDKKPSAWYGGLLASAYMLNIEILDGFSSEWGFSLGDFTANELGAAMFVSQQLIWGEQRFRLKFSFHQTTYAVYRPDLLGYNITSQILKDYNGQSYWFSGNISTFLPKTSRFPKWLNIAFGYGAGGMTGAASNTSSSSIPQQERYRRFMLSVDVDLTRIPTRSKFLKAAFTVLSFIKIPAPAIEYNTLGNFRFYPIYY
ncbi:MAG: DUF2279 domain-containing protein [Bacteroidetes bacterium]|nr:MAG: DUF2279 domain-containing protein [Bacteroidota bacterium]